MMFPRYLLNLDFPLDSQGLDLLERLKQAGAVWEPHSTPAHLEPITVSADYVKSILPAHKKGQKTIWVNSNHHPAQAHHPFHTTEITDPTDLPDALEYLHLPEVETCLFWLAEQKATFYLLQHVQLVAAIAYQLSLWLRAAKISVNPVLTHRGGLLHDLAKLSSRASQAQPELDHGQAAAYLLQALNQPELAMIADRHMIYTLGDPLRQPRTWEQKLVYFSDKLAEGGRVVTIEERVEALRQRYHVPEEQSRASLAPLAALQHEICAACDISFNDLIPRLRAAL